MKELWVEISRSGFISLMLKKMIDEDYCHLGCDAVHCVRKLVMFWRSMFASIFALEDMYPIGGVAGTSKILVTANRNTQLHIQEHSNLNIDCHENLRFQNVVDIFQ